MKSAHKPKNIAKDITFLAAAEFIELTGIQPGRLEELMALEWLCPHSTEQKECCFCQEDVYRVRKLERICCDFELPVVGGTIIVDLLERISLLEQRVENLRRMNGV